LQLFLLGKPVVKTLGRSYERPFQFNAPQKYYYHGQATQKDDMNCRKGARLSEDST